MIGKNRPLHQQRARKAWPFLVKRANSGGKPFSYKELGDLIGIHWRAVGWALGEIQAYCKRNRLPPLQALVVHGTADRLPGRGYHGSDRNARDHERAVAAVHAHRWDLAPPAFSSSN